MRNNDWLNEKLGELLENGFADLEKPNTIKIAFGRKARRRLGSIKMSRDKKVSHITINGIFRDETLPENIVDAIIAHELSHYAHGFSSPLPKLYSHPHKGNVIGRELRKRGLHFLEEYEKSWTKNHWPKVLEKEFPRKARSIRRKTYLLPKSIFDFFHI
jgi:hypothetical protein